MTTADCVLIVAPRTRCTRLQGLNHENLCDTRSLLLAATATPDRCVTDFCVVGMAKINLCGDVVDYSGWSLDLRLAVSCCGDELEAARNARAYTELHT